MPNHDDIRFPLDSFLERLALEGIEASVPQRLQLLDMLSRFGPEVLDNPSQLKYKIAPLLAKNAGQQHRIHQLFEEFIAEAVGYTPPPPPASKPWWERLQRWQWGGIALALFILPLILIEERLRATAVEPPLEARFDTPTQVTLGEDIAIRNTSLHVDTINTLFRWELFDEERGERELDTIVSDLEWQFPFTSLGESPDKFIVLTATDTLRNERSTYKKRFQVHCTDLPDKPRIIAPIKAFKDSLVSFRLGEKAKPEWEYTWKFGDASDTTGRSASHVFVEPGVYQVLLQIQKEADGYCQVDTTHTITITNKNDEKAYLADLPLVLDEAQGTSSELNFYWMSWLLLALLLLYALYQFWRWLHQPPPIVSAAEQKEDLDERFASADRGPYNIPFEHYENNIQVEETLFRLADKLRRRQEEGRMVLDVQASVRQTVDQGGFPILLEKRTSLPPEYLFLIDEQAEKSHQAELYKYLMTFLRDKDVFITTFYYNTSFHRFWNPDFPDGVTLERLRQLYPRHRLVVLGDGLDLLDQHGEQLQMKAAYCSVLEEWDSRLLLTPIPPSSWTFKEATLYQTFPIFDSDASGFSAALKYLDVLAEEADEPGPRPSFTEWQEGQSLPPVHPDVNHRIWRKLSTYQDYLKEYPQVYRWLCALAVYPEANWQMTLAIGRAIDAPVNFDNLLLLSRIPWLQGKTLHPKVRQQLLDEIDLETEQLARAAVQEALAEVAPKVAGSHVNTDLQTNLAIQSFLLNPEDLENRALIEQLQQHKMLSKRQQLDLDRGIERKTNGAAKDLAAYMLGAGETVLRQENAPLFFNNNFYLGAFAATIALILGLFMLQFNGSETLREWVYGETDTTQAFKPKTPAQYGYFLKEETVQDSAIIFNNLAVESWNRSMEASGDSIRLLENASYDLLDKALGIRDDYLIAKQNKAKLRYNYGVHAYNDYLEFDQQRETLERAEQFFERAEADTSIVQESQHALGLCAYYQNEISEARVRYEDLLLTGFFDKFPLEPNLQSLLDPQAREPVFTGEGCNPQVAFSIANEIFCRGDEIVVVNDSPSDQSFEYFLLDWGDGQQDSLTDFEQIRHTFRSGRAWNVRLTGYMQCDSTGRISRTASQRVSALAPASAPLADDKRIGCAPMTVSYNATGLGNVEHEWRIFRASEATSQEPEQKSLPTQTTPTRPQVIYSSSDPALRYNFTDPGNYQIWLYVQNACGRDSNFSLMQVLPPEECGGGRPGIAGLVLGTNKNSKAGRQPIAGATVDWESGKTTTDAQGNFKVPTNDIQENAITIDVEHPDYLTKAQAFNLQNYDGGTLTITLQAKEGDRDGDGVIDSLDDCPDQPGAETAQGCPDRDQDGIPDQRDVCPELAGQLEDDGCPVNDEQNPQQYEVVFQNSWVKSRDLLGDRYFLSVEDKVFIWPQNIKRGSVVLLINQDRTNASRDTELFYGELEPGQKVQVRTDDVIYQITLEKIARAGLIRTRGAYFKAEKETLEEEALREDEAYTIQVATYRNRPALAQLLLRTLPEDVEIWEEDVLGQDGVKRLNVGFFESRTKAQEVLDGLRQITGADGSFIRKMNQAGLGSVADLRSDKSSVRLADNPIDLYFDENAPDFRTIQSTTDGDYLNYLDSYSAKLQEIAVYQCDQEISKAASDMQRELEKTREAIIDLADKIFESLNPSPQKGSSKDAIKPGDVFIIIEVPSAINASNVYANQLAQRRLDSFKNFLESRFSQAVGAEQASDLMNSIELEMRNIDHAPNPAGYQEALENADKDCRPYIPHNLSNRRLTITFAFYTDPE